MGIIFNARLPHFSIFWNSPPQIRLVFHYFTPAIFSFSPAKLSSKSRLFAAVVAQRELCSQLLAFSQCFLAAIILQVIFLLLASLGRTIGSVFADLLRSLNKLLSFALRPVFLAVRSGLCNVMTSLHIVARWFLRWAHRGCLSSGFLVRRCGNTCWTALLKHLVPAAGLCVVFNLDNQIGWLPVLWTAVSEIGSRFLAFLRTTNEPMPAQASSSKVSDQSSALDEGLYHWPSKDPLGNPFKFVMHPWVEAILESPAEDTLVYTHTPALQIMILHYLPTATTSSSEGESHNDEDYDMGEVPRRSLSRKSLRDYPLDRRPLSPITEASSRPSSVGPSSPASLSSSATRTPSPQRDEDPTGRALDIALFLDFSVSLRGHRLVTGESGPSEFQTNAAAVEDAHQRILAEDEESCLVRIAGRIDVASDEGGLVVGHTGEGAVVDEAAAQEVAAAGLAPLDNEGPDRRCLPACDSMRCSGECREGFILL
ncbi:hypothetical protein B0H16DRAFT_1538859 [Mycena metata]|uniref:Uncharacterized protein n=1 Tax=Mycena metata TaxID=1033252 RepID=A0AAD7J6K9_9AGAR|nr:hypothetical protein B0H16DRAFT_1538859 [Mycena metata]